MKILTKTFFLLTLTALILGNNPVNAKFTESKVLGCHNSITKEIRDPIKNDCHLGGKYYNKWTAITLEKWQFDIINKADIDIYDKLALIGIKSNECSDPDGLCVRRHSDYGPFQINFIHDWAMNKTEFYVALIESLNEKISLKEYILKYNSSKKLSFFDSCGKYESGKGFTSFSKCYSDYGIREGQSQNYYRDDLFKYQMYWSVDRFKRIEKKHSCSKDNESYVKCQMWYHNGNMSPVSKGSTYKVADFYADKGMKVIPFILNKHNSGESIKYLSKYYKNSSDEKITQLSNVKKIETKKVIENKKHISNTEKRLIYKLDKKTRSLEKKYSKKQLSPFYKKIESSAYKNYKKTGNKLYLYLGKYFSEKNNI